LLAFAMDTELRKLGVPGLMDFMKPLYGGADRIYSIGDLREHLMRLDLQAFYDRHFHGKDVPDLQEDFSVAGGPMIRADCQITYFSIQTEDRQTVAELDGVGAWIGLGRQPPPTASAGVRSRTPKLRDSVQDVAAEHDFDRRAFL
jgi:hypothetical protein